MNLMPQASRLTAALLAVLLLGSGITQAQDAPRRLMSPVHSQVETPKPPAQSIARGKDVPTPYITRTGSVMLDVAQLMRRPASSVREAPSTDTAVAASGNEPFILEVFDYHEYAVQVTSESHPAPDVLNITGAINNEEIATVSITVTSESYLITIQDLKTATVYRIVGNTETGLGTVTEVDLRKMPPILYSPPIVAP